MERRLAAILAADVVGYSRLMQADEDHAGHDKRCAHAKARTLPLSLHKPAHGAGSRAAMLLPRFLGSLPDQAHGSKGFLRLYTCDALTPHHRCYLSYVSV